MRNYLLLFSIVLMMAFTAIAPSAQATTKNYAGNTHEAAIDYLVKKGALTPNSKGEYEVRNNVTRGEFASYLAIVLQLPHVEEGQAFTDVAQNTALSRYVASATAAGIIKGYPDNTFNPEAYISRQHMATMLKRAMDYLNITPETYTPTVFKDEQAILSEHKTAVQLGAALNIIKGSPQKDGTYFMPQSNALISQAASFIQRMMNVAGDADAHIVEYKVANLINGAVVPVATYSSLTDANKARSGNQVVTKDGVIVAMAPGAGIVETKKYVIMNATDFYDQFGFAGKTQMEFLGLDETGTKATVQFMGKKGTVDSSSLNFHPFELSKGRSYYENRGGELYNVYVNPTTGIDGVSFHYAKAPSFMQPNVKYYSWNGVDFFDGSGKKAGEYYNYYQLLPAYTKTAYTAEELDQYVMQLLQQREANPTKAIYYNATTKSKLIGIGAYLKAVEEEYHINAALILSLALNESDHGLSDHATKNSNLFGLHVKDTSPEGKFYNNIEENIQDLLHGFFLKNYIPPRTANGGAYAYGAVLGSKYFGMNVKYASDPFWGQKAASYYYRLDKALGGKDAAQDYKVGLTTQYVNVRSVPTTVGNERLFQYPGANYPVLILDDSNIEWYKIISDVDRTSEAYINKAYVKAIQTTK